MLRPKKGRSGYARLGRRVITSGFDFFLKWWLGKWQELMVISFVFVHIYASFMFIYFLN